MRNPTVCLAAALVAFLALTQGRYCFAEPAAASASQPAQEWSMVGSPLSGDDLEGQSGKKNIEIGDLNIHMIDTDTTGFLGDNKLILEGSSNGANSIIGNAFAGASGIATVIQNSGNQVLIQNATVVDVTMK